MTGMPRSSAWSGALVGGAAGAFVATLLTVGMTSEHRSPPATMGVDLDPLLEKLGALEALVRSHPGQPPPESPAREALAPESARSAPDQPHLATSEDLAELRARIELLAQRFAADASAIALPVRPPPDWNRLGQLHELWRRDEVAAQGSVRLLTVPQLVQSYGMPTDIASPTGNLFYRWPDEQREIGFILKDGYVIGLWGK